MGSGIAADAAGNVYVTGTTESPSFRTVHPLPAPNNALQGTENAFVSKLSFDRATSKLSLAYSDSAPASVEIEAVRPGIELTREVRSLQRVIADLAPNAFKHRKLQNSLLKKLNAVLGSIREHRYSHALQQLEHDILDKTNGCATSGAPDKNDWIVSCPDQSKVYTPLFNIRADQGFR